MTQTQVQELIERITGKRLQRAQSVAGLVWVREHSGRRYAMAPSTSQPGTYHKVDGLGCDCKSYAHRGYCCHSDAVYLKLRERQHAAERAACEAAQLLDGDAAHFTAWTEKLDRALQLERDMLDVYGNEAA